MLALRYSPITFNLLSLRFCGCLGEGMKSFWFGVALAVSMLSAAAQDRYQPRTPRGQAAGAIVLKWSGYVHRVYDVAPAAWARAMKESFAQADLRNLRKAAAMQTYEGMMATLLGQRTTDARVIDRLARSRGTKEELMALGSPAEDLVYTMITPCRIVDTRNAGGRMGSGEVRSFSSSGTSFASQGGADGDCAMPADASAVVLNVVAVGPDGDGFVTVYPYGLTRPNASSLNYHRNQIVANEIIARQALGQPHDFSVYTHVATDVVMDVVGYFMAPHARALECTQLSSEPTTIFNNMVPYMLVASPECPTGYTLTGGGCRTDDDTPSSQGLYFVSFGKSPATGSNAYQCYVQNIGTTVRKVVADGICCRVPGR
jgi:hypothetical protein